MIDRSFRSQKDLMYLGIYVNYLCTYVSYSWSGTYAYTKGSPGLGVIQDNLALHVWIITL
jgi:hypothetical protein